MGCLEKDEPTSVRLFFVHVGMWKNAETLAGLGNNEATLTTSMVGGDGHIIICTGAVQRKATPHKAVERRIQNL